MQLSKQFLVRWRRFHGDHCPDGNTHIKNGVSCKKYSKFILTIHINPNSYSFRKFKIMFITIIVPFFIICFINGWKYEKVSTNWCVYLIEEFFSASHYTLSSCRHCFRGSAATKKWRELSLNDPVRCHGSILITMRNPVRDDARRTIALLQRSNIPPKYCKVASSEVCIFLRCTIVHTLYYFSVKIWELLYRISA